MLELVPPSGERDRERAVLRSDRRMRLFLLCPRDEPWVVEEGLESARLRLVFAVMDGDVGRVERMTLDPIEEPPIRLARVIPLARPREDEARLRAPYGAARPRRFTERARFIRHRDEVLSIPDALRCNGAFGQPPREAERARPRFDLRLPRSSGDRSRALDDTRT
jgi:hypothetical protein